MITRRKLITAAGALAGGAAALGKLHALEEVETREPGKPLETTAAATEGKPLLDRIDPKPTEPPGQPGEDYTPVITPNKVSLPWKIVDGVKVYHLIAEEVQHEFARALKRTAGVTTAAFMAQPSRLSRVTVYAST
jgi:manganese oxidase